MSESKGEIMEQTVKTVTTMEIDAFKQVDPVFLAMSKLQRRHFDECIDICSRILEKNPYDKAVWCLKTRALTLKNWIDDSELEEEGIAEMLMDDNAVSQAPRPGTSLSRSSAGGGSDQGIRPMSASGRPLTGFARPGTSSRSVDSNNADSAFKGDRPGTSRPMTALGRRVRLGTASMLTEGGVFINVDRLDLAKYAKRPAIAKVLCDYLLYHDHNPQKALELASKATVASNYTDWWWKARLGKCYYQLGLLRDGEKQFKSAIKDQSMIVTVLELAKVFIRLDQPNKALDVYNQACDDHQDDSQLLLGIARIYEMLNNVDLGVTYYKRVLHLDASNVEAIACLASFHFYNDQSEVAMRYYRRLVQMGLNNTELWNNLGLCCFYASQYDMSLNCFERALNLSDDQNMADVWYNIGQVAIGIGDLGVAYQAFKIAVSVDSNHAQSYNNLGVLEIRKGGIDQARSNFQMGQKLAPFMFESLYNAALLAYKLGDFQESFQLVNQSLKVFPSHSDSCELVKLLNEHFNEI